MNLPPLPEPELTATSFWDPSTSMISIALPSPLVITLPSAAVSPPITFSLELRLRKFSMAMPVSPLLMWLPVRTFRSFWM
jgi:hypothetical protein